MKSKSMLIMIKTGPCRFNATNVAATDTGYMVIEAGDEEALKAAVAMVGPIAVGMDATRPDFLFYSKGSKMK